MCICMCVLLFSKQKCRLYSVATNILPAFVILLLSTGSVVATCGDIGCTLLAAGCLVGFHRLVWRANIKKYTAVNKAKKQKQNQKKSKTKKTQKQLRKKQKRTEIKENKVKNKKNSKLADVATMLHVEVTLQLGSCYMASNTSCIKGMSGTRLAALCSSVQIVILVLKWVPKSNNKNKQCMTTKLWKCKKIDDKIAVRVLVLVENIWKLLQQYKQACISQQHMCSEWRDSRDMVFNSPCCKPCQTSVQSMHSVCTGIYLYINIFFFNSFAI